MMDIQRYSAADLPTLFDAIQKHSIGWNNYFDRINDIAHRGMAQRSFSRSWSLSDDIEVREVVFEDGLLSITLGKVVPEHHARKDYI
jgi:hypothetical protein